ncbi:MAG: hypothetical protein OES26_18365 [Gammaproteobacteria bacterium]|nr:hypothetical protein [Gammaproteobacteria bacterium]
MSKITKRKTTVKGESIGKRLDSAIANINNAANDVSKALKVRSSESKKLVASVKRLNKKRAALAKRAQTAAARWKRSASAEHKKALVVIQKELVAVRKLLVKTRAQRGAAAAELAVVKSVNRKVAAYSNAIGQADKILNKTKTKRKKRRVKSAE